jgi:hypothetical protein
MNAFTRQYSTISPLPIPDVALPFELPSGYVLLFRDPDWSGRKLDLSTHRFCPDVRHDLRRRSGSRRAAWVAFNLPEGQVMTLTKRHRDVEDGQPAHDLRDVAQVADLVGSGKTEAVDLTQIDMGNAVASLFWRTVNLDTGAIELYSEPGFKGNRTVLFLSEWQRGHLHTLTDWVIEDRLGSVRWTALRGAQYCDLFQHADGLGGRYPRLKASQTGFNEAPDISARTVNDMVSAFRWGVQTPSQDVLEQFSLEASFTRPMRPVSSHADVTAADRR